MKNILSFTIITYIKRVFDIRKLLRPLHRI
jgi:hypothetical protein